MTTPPLSRLGFSPMDYVMHWEVIWAHCWAMPVRRLRPPTAPSFYARATQRAPRGGGGGGGRAHRRGVGRAVPRQAVFLAWLVASLLWQYTKTPKRFRREYMGAGLNMFTQRETVLRGTRPDVAERS
jgi:hypothetical protein